jgi:hypothetical protein
MPLSERNGERQTAFAKQPFEGRAREVFAGRFQGFAQEQEARGVVCDGQRSGVIHGLAGGSKAQI